ncbi:MAG: hypothetical protein QXP80_07260 [Zestosphaera sp.]
MERTSKAGLKGYVKTNIFLTAYDEGLIDELLRELDRRGFRVLESSKSEVVDHLYFISVEGDAREVKELLEGKAAWLKVELLEFK